MGILEIDAGEGVVSISRRYGFIKLQRRANTDVAMQMWALWVARSAFPKDLDGRYSSSCGYLFGGRPMLRS